MILYVYIYYQMDNSNVTLFPRPNPLNLPLSNLDNFKEICILGKGNYGTVGKYLNLQTNSQCAIKTIKVKDFNPKQMLMIQRQIQLLYKVNSDYIVKIIDHFQDQENVYLITQFINGKDLYKSIFKDKKVVSYEVVGKIIYQIAAALQQLHRHYIIHRDLKLQNIVFCANGNIKIVDFGCSNYYGDNVNRYTAIGTKPYWCPELLNGQKQDDRLDVWCLGVLLYELVVLQSPFTDPDMFGKIRSLKYQIPQKLDGQIELSSLLKNTLTYRKDRLRASQVKTHPFIKKYYNSQESEILLFQNHFDKLTVQEYRQQLVQIIQKYKKDINILRSQNQQLQNLISENKRQLKNAKN